MKRVILLAIVALVISSGCGNSNGNLATSSTAQQFASPTPTPPPQSTPIQQPPRETGDVEIIAPRANLRALPNASSDVVKELAKGDQLTLLADGATGAWYNVRDLDSGKSGWIHGNSIKIVSSTPEKSAETDTTARHDETRAAKNENSSSRSSDTYTNVDGDQIPRPRKSTSVPEGATAKCRDGSYSFSRHRQGTCSHHGGVANWL